MKNRTIILSLFIVTSFANSSEAQVQQAVDMNASNHTIVISGRLNRAVAMQQVDGVTTYYYGENAAIEMVGSPYLFDDFKQGSLLFADSMRIVDVELRYDAYNDEMQLKMDADTFGLHPSYKIMNVTMGDMIFIYSLIYDKSTKNFTDGYFELLLDGEVQLLKRHEKAFKQDSYVSNYNGGGGDDAYHFFDKEFFYFKPGRESAEKITGSKKKFIQRFPDYNDELLDFIDEQKLSLRKEDDLLKLFNYYNGLK